MNLVRLRDSETFGIEKGYGDKAIEWLNKVAQDDETKV